MIATQSRAESRQELLARLAQARDLTDSLFRVARSNSLYERPIPERHRIVFYLGHLEAFDWNLLKTYVLGAKPFHPEFDRLFAFGIDPVGGGLPSDQPSDWPSLGEIHDYNNRIRQALGTALEAARFADSNLDSQQPEIGFDVLLNVAIEHRLMHAETLTYMLHQLPLELKIPQPKALAAQATPFTFRMVEIPAGSATLGLPRDGGREFGWDNEFEAHTVAVQAFAIDANKVTNGQYLQFVTAGGYEDRAFWTEANWKWKTEQNITHPWFWNRRGSRWSYRTMFAEAPLPLEWPVYVSHAEASAYARWVGKVLPTEAQWHRAAFGTAEGSERAFPWGSQPPNSSLGNFDFQLWDPTPVNAYPAGRSAFGLAGLVGNGWEWTSTLFEPFPGFQPFPFYQGYSAAFFDGTHYVLKGGSARTAACMLRRSFRNWFQPHYPYVYAGFRCVSE